ncbi:MAG: hypothetical protein AB7S70_06895 [Hyphomicrobium sp.]|uniref:hypothetical protein n=1 Tax=Hyphomicrobium sp. TaxID=82 RepID=UPI003D0D525D
MRRAALILVLALAACEEPRSEAYTPENEISAFKPVAVALEPAEAAQKIDGIATLVSPDALTQLNSEIRAAEIAFAFSQRTVERFKGTSSLGEHRLDNAERQAATDATQVALLELKLRNAWGETAPFLAASNRQRLVDELSSGKTTLVRVDFPRAVERDPKNVRIAPLGGGEETALTEVWPAPSGNLAMPGTSFFGIMPTGPGLRPGDRAKVTAERSTPTSGVIVPAAAMVVHAGESWCYVETEPGEFERRRVSLAMPVAEGYLTKDFSPGTKVVVQGASALLSREAEPGSFDDDDDDGGDERPRARKAAPKDDGATESEHRATPLASSDPD